MSKPFIFKKFSVNQQNHSFKVGTDSIILGAIVNQNINPKNILDIGTGTGLLALMMAQKFKTSKIDAIDIQKECVLLAQKNFEKSDWINRLSAIHKSLQDFNPTKKYELIICNPPYFENSLANQSKQKAISRHLNPHSFSLDVFFNQTKKLLQNNGSIYFCYPKNQEDKIDNHIFNSELYLSNKYYIKSSALQTPYLIIYKLMFSSIQNPLIEDLAIRNSKNEYTQEFITLTQEFYLNF